MGRTPSLLSSATRRQDISLQCEAKGWKELSIQLSRLATMTLNSSDAQPKQMSQFLISIASTPSAHTVPESFDATHIMSSSVKSRGMILDTFSYSLKDAHVGFSAGWTHMSGHFSQRNSSNSRLVFLHWSSSRSHPPPTWQLTNGRPALYFSTALYCGRFGTRLGTPHPLL